MNYCNRLSDAGEVTFEDGIASSENLQQVEYKRRIRKTQSGLPVAYVQQRERVFFIPGDTRAIGSSTGQVGVVMK